MKLLLRRIHIAESTFYHFKICSKQVINTSYQHTTTCCRSQTNCTIIKLWSKPTRCIAGSVLLSTKNRKCKHLSNENHQSRNILVNIIKYTFCTQLLTGVFTVLVDTPLHIFKFQKRRRGEIQKGVVRIFSTILPYNELYLKTIKSVLWDRVEEYV